MSIFDKDTTEFLKSQEHNHRCNLCGKIMKFLEEHGYYQCKTCKGKGGDPVIKAPNILIGTGNKPIKLFWATCPNCSRGNVNDESQEAFLQITKLKTVHHEQTAKELEDGTINITPEHDEKVFDKVVWEKNKNQEKIMCTSCKVQFVKKGVKT